MKQRFTTTSERPITGNLPRMTFCYKDKPADYTGYYLPHDLPTTQIPISHRPTWKGVNGSPNQAPPSLIDTPGIHRPALNENGFIPHKGEFVHYTSAVDNESSLRNLDQHLTSRAFGQRILLPSSRDTKLGVDARDECSMSVSRFRTGPGEGSICGMDRRYDSANGMNGVRFNNSTRLTTKNMKLPIVEQSAGWIPQEHGKIGTVPNRRS